MLKRRLKNKIQIINAVETYRQVDKLLGQVEKQINKSNLVPNDKDIDENTQLFAQAGGSGYTNNFFSDGSRDMFYDKFLEDQKNKQREIFQKKFKVSKNLNRVGIRLLNNAIKDKTTRVKIIS